MNEELLNKLIAAKTKLDAQAAEEEGRKEAEEEAKREATREQGRQAVEDWLNRADPEEIVKELYEAWRAHNSPNRFIYPGSYARKFSAIGSPVFDEKVFGEAVLGRLLEVHAELEASMEAD